MEGMKLSYAAGALSAMLMMLRPWGDQALDFRVSLPSPEELSRMLSGLANSEGGMIVVGAENSDVVVGINNNHLERNIKSAKELLYGRIEVDCSTMLVEQKTFGIIKVKASEIPVSTVKGYFKRVGDEYVLLDASQLFAKSISAPDHTAVISSLSEMITSQSSQFEKLRESFEKANSWKKSILLLCRCSYYRDS
ncbi:putative DNA binding domain-containing protein [Pseudomonas sp. CBSPCBW29]|nr:putative DNA binding domain-containing protein [Pseudomonas sp. CBSPAW29]WEL85485.1 putative DNA binding domain-containing protein [Pseudomonas sp. CBSPCAW29]WEL91414.1 putative DNA binding domain-containing protein [Pseudomonas sp. CBSPCBW29]